MSPPLPVICLPTAIASPGLSFEEADALIAAYESDGLGPFSLVDQQGAYGCNMVIRAAARPDARFDENLPLYGWLEDLDFSAAFAAAGRVVKSNLCVGVHLGVKSGRSPGLQVGYSQIANPHYLATKGTMDPRRALKKATQNVIANLVRSFAPEPYVDRRGRLRGNLLAFSDLMRNRIHPMRVLDLATASAAERPAREATSAGISSLRKRPTSKMKTPEA